jgi:hypothetical protein
MLGDEGQNFALALTGQTVCVGGDLNLVDLPARKTIHGVENLERPNQVEFVHERDRDHDDPSA